MQIINKANHNTSVWSGGTTTELFIFPPNSSYAKRNFKYRISTAKVNVEKSTFTRLDGVHREIMILDGQIVLSHQGHYTKKLKKFETDSFQGNWETTSKGIVTDFNIMTEGDYNGKIIPYILKNNEILSYSNTSNSIAIILYVFSGEIKIESSIHNAVAKEGDIIVFDSITEYNKYIITSILSSEIIISNIEKKNKIIS